MRKGDVYNQKLLNKRLREDDDAVSNLYYNNGYVFSSIDPAEQNIVGDSIDLEMRVLEGPQAHLSHVRINGNDRLYENVVRRELRTKPGDLFSKEALMRSARELASMGFFDPEKVTPDVKPNAEDGTVDINWNLTQKSNDQIEFSLGWGQTGIIGRVGLTLNNFSMANLFNKNKEHRGIMPIGDGEKLSIGVQTNGSYYQSYNTSYSTNWFGGKRPIQFSVGAFYSKQTDVSSNYYNSLGRTATCSRSTATTAILTTIAITRTTTTPTSMSNSLVRASDGVSACAGPTTISTSRWSSRSPATC